MADVRAKYLSSRRAGVQVAGQIPLNEFVSGASSREPASRPIVRFKRSAIMELGQIFSSGGAACCFSIPRLPWAFPVRPWRAILLVRRDCDASHDRGRKSCLGLPKELEFSKLLAVPAHRPLDRSSEPTPKLRWSKLESDRTASSASLPIRRTSLPLGGIDLVNNSLICSNCKSTAFSSAGRKTL
jgi:hypothetical protein